MFQESIVITDNILAKGDIDHRNTQVYSNTLISAGVLCNRDELHQ